MNLAGIDLNLLLVFDTIMQERNVTRAGDQIGMSQPAVSNALNRLRHHLKDELFVRSSDGMRPTARAVEIAGPIHVALQNVSNALEPAAFDPATAKRRFSIGTNDFFVAAIMPQLLSKIEKTAPGVDIRLISSAGQTFDMLDTQQIDLGISTFGAIPDRFEAQLLLDNSYVLMMRKGHPLSKKKVSINQFLDAQHLIVSPSGQTEGFVDEILKKQGKSRRIAMVVNSFSSAPAMLANTDLILTTPKHIADVFCPLYELVTQPALFSGPPEFSRITLVWHKHLASHPAYMWLREMIEDVATSLSAATKL